MSLSERVLPIVMLSLLAGPVYAAKIEHTNVVEPKLAATAPPDLSAIGQPTRLIGRGGTLYVAGVNGIAAVSAEGKILWSTALDPTGVREIEVDDTGIAYTGYEIVGSKTSVWAFLGEMPKKMEFAPSIIGMLAPDGTKIWQAAGPASRISAPCLTPASVAVLLGQTFQIYARTDGKVTISKVDLDPAMLPNEYAGRMFRPKPLYVDGNFVGGYFYKIYRLGPNGEEQEVDSKNKTNVVAGPILFKGNMLIGSYGMKPDGSVNESLVTVLETKGEFKKVMRKEIGDDHSATGDMVVEGDTIYASSNFTVSAIDTVEGKRIWDVQGEDGALSAGSMRGVRFARNFGYRYWGGHLMVLAGDHLCLSTRREIAKKTWADVITVLNKKDGTYVKTIDLKKDIVDMTVSGDRLALATEDGLKYLTLD